MSNLVQYINFGIDPSAPENPVSGKRLYLLPNGDFATIDPNGVVTPLATDWASITGKPTAFTPSAHAASHAVGGTDALTPAQIGAEPAFTALPISKGGTGATTAAQARTNLGITGGGVTSYNDLTDKPTTFAPSTHAASHATGGSDALTPAQIGAATSSHTHGNITTAGAIGTVSGVPIITGSNGLLQAGSFGTTAGSFCQGDDSRLSNSRVPTQHKSTHAIGGNDVITPKSIGAATMGVLLEGKFVPYRGVTNGKVSYYGLTSGGISEENALIEWSSSAGAWTVRFLHPTGMYGLEYFAGTGDTTYPWEATNLPSLQPAFNPEAKHKHNLSDLNSSGATANQVPVWNGAAWVPQNQSGGTAQVNSDWSATSGVAQILNKPELAAVATSGAYGDLADIPKMDTPTGGVYPVTGQFLPIPPGLFAGVGAVPRHTGWEWTVDRLTLADLKNGNPLALTGQVATWDGQNWVPQDAPAGVTSYNDLTDKPTIPAAQVNSDWSATSGVEQILNKPSTFTPSTHAASHAAGGSDALTPDAIGALGLSASSYVIAKAGDDLAAKYAAAKALTPNGAAKSATNRATLLLMPGSYSLSAELVIDTEFVDVVAIDSQANAPSVFVTENTLNVNANNIRVSGISVGTLQFKITGDKPLQIFENCTGGDGSFGGGSASSGNVASGTFTNCTAGAFSFAGGVLGNVASGKFTNCTAGEHSFAGNRSGNIGGSNASGTFMNCIAGSYSFGGASSIASGTFTNCKGGTYCFGGGGTFGNNGNASGTFTNCTAGNYSFGGWNNTASGKFTNCTGGTESFGGGTSNGTANGTFTGCRLTTGTFKALSAPATGRAIMINCIDGNNDIINGVAPLT